MCSYEGCQDFPQYGTAPHECYWRKPGGFEANPLGTSTIDPVSEWPDNFLAEVDLSISPEQNLKWGLCGVYYCPSCKSGMPEVAGRHGGIPYVIENRSDELLIIE